ncbi:Histidinol-phosphate aminotransferase [Lachnospiraceae bacterium TWA4]|nr:Histidinol-phosphate aminotransferase [Lachnospiraceae bacterium TWA4]
MWKDYIRKVVPYTPGEQPKNRKVIKLNTNENPYPPTPKVAKALEDFNKDCLRLYPDPTASALTKTLADYHGVDEDEVFVGVGSDDVIAMAFLTFFNSDKPILFPDITYSFYSVWADLYRIPYERPALDKDFKLVKEDYYKENGGIIFPNPNAPTSLAVSLDFIEDILKHNQDSLVIVDEAYIDFGGDSALALLNKYENLLVIRTFSKSRSMAGMRIGYAIGNKFLIKALNDVKYSYNSYTMNQTSLVFGKESVLDDNYFKETVDKIVATREHAKKRFEELGFTCLDSKANFLFVTHKCVPAKQIFTQLKENGIFVRYFDSPRIDNYLRVTIGTDEEMEALYKFLERYVVNA